MPPKVTACLLTYNRLDALTRVVYELKQKDFIDEILVWNNGNPIDSSRCSELMYSGVELVINSRSNLYDYSRYKLALLARNDFIYLQDDDAIIHNISEIYNEFINNDHNIVCAMIEEKIREYVATGTAMVGHGCFFKKSLLTEDKIFDDYLERFGETLEFKKYADRVFTGLAPKRKLVVTNREDLKVDISTVRHANPAHRAESYAIIDAVKKFKKERNIE
jgi:hypothetical protein